ncbi:fructosamine kinase family protein [Virgibacillus salexigens]|uniref:fructosamine kinase family protein n=1 Tax=Virgibacillus salexigens TaxID=61016 RepID=UPI00190A8A72|nr:fructosamine kinase family protein [Virgibacillus salexigens]
MNTLFKSALERAGDSSTLLTIKKVAGGSINESYIVETKKRSYFVKYHKDAPERFFELEAKGLQLIKYTNTIDVPEVIDYSDEQEEAYLVLEHVQGERNNHTERLLGERLAGLHQTIGQAHGFREPTFIGTLTQPNGLYDSWLEYYRDRRLAAQLKLGIRNKRMVGKRKKKLENLLNHLDQWIPRDIEPSYLHGDLWGGNWIVGGDGHPYLIDPSFLYGDRHFELAFTEVFGGFSEQFYQAYEATYPTSNHYQSCKKVYQLYYLLVHLNLFGEMYGSEVDAILNHYVR